MRNTILLLACAGISGCSAREHAAPESGGAEYRAGEWRLVEDWPDLPADVILGAVSDVALDAAGNVILFHRAGRPFNQVGLDSTHTIADNTILELRHDGRLRRQWGAGMFYMPHSIAVDVQDRVWIVDTGAQQIHRLTRTGEITLSMGVSREGGWSRTHFDRPTDVLVRADGSFHVSDGYLNARVVSFDASGRYVHEWGGKGTAPGQFATPHAIPANAAIRIAAHGLAVSGDSVMYLADTGGRRIWKLVR